MHKSWNHLGVKVTLLIKPSLLL